jgi:hypothetical protein
LVVKIPESVQQPAGPDLPYADGVIQAWLIDADLIPRKRIHRSLGCWYRKDCPQLESI